MQQSLFGSAVLGEAAPSSGGTDLETPLDDVLFTVVDLETTGLNPRKNAITEITAIRFCGGDEREKYSTLVKPTEEIPAQVTAITGITNDMVLRAPALVMALGELCSFAGASPVIVGHNVGFDLGFLREKLDQTNLSAFLPRFDPEKALCTKKLAQRILPGLPSYEGLVVASQCGVHNPNPHRAEYDVRMCAGILFVLIKRLRQETPDIQTLGDLLAFQGGI